MEDEFRGLFCICHQNICYQDMGCRFLLLILGLCIQNLCFGENGCIKLPAFATGNRNLACLGCKELFILATIFHQNLQSGCKHS